MRVVAGAERLNLALTKVGNPPIYDKTVFPWVRAIERDWGAIRAELDHVLTRKEELPGIPRTGNRRLDHKPGSRLEDLPACWLRLPFQKQYQVVPGNLAHLPEHPGSDHRHVFDPRARQTSAAASRAL